MEADNSVFDAKQSIILTEITHVFRMANLINNKHSSKRSFSIESILAPDFGKPINFAVFSKKNEIAPKTKQKCPSDAKKSKEGKMR